GSKHRVPIGRSQDDTVLFVSAVLCGRLACPSNLGKSVGTSQIGCFVPVEREQACVFAAIRSLALKYQWVLESSTYMVYGKIWVRGTGMALTISEKQKEKKNGMHGGCACARTPSEAKAGSLFGCATEQEERRMREAALQRFNGDVSCHCRCPRLSVVLFT
uniref:Uncharacterized protein n=1 Tax=Aegilops tauschii subsp. strangulata TaxID=200361 RepID=A0A453C1Z8_AEGTS